MFLNPCNARTVANMAIQLLNAEIFQDVPTAVHRTIKLAGTVASQNA